MRDGMNYSDDFDDAPVAPTKRGGGGGGGPPPFETGSTGGLYPCSICNRTFASDRIQQHEDACKRSHKQRKVFDSTKQRVQGTEAAAFLRKTKGKAQPSRPQVHTDADD